MARFWSKVQQAGDSCWLWKYGYRRTSIRPTRAQFGFEGRTYPAGRVMWSLVNGPIPDGLWVLHTCDDIACVNPGHLFLGTRSDNVRDMINKGRGWHSDPEKVRRFNNSIAERYRRMVTCKKCGHQWRPRVDNPIACPHCLSRKWNEPKELEPESEAEEARRTR